MSFITSRSFEKRLLDRKQSERALRDQGMSVDPQTVARITGIRKNWPGLRPGAIVGFAQAGLDETAPEVKEAAQLAYKQTSNENKWKIKFKDYDEAAIEKQGESDKPDPQFVLRSLLPQWQKLEQKRQRVLESGDWEDSPLPPEQEAKYQQLGAGLKYAMLAYNDESIIDVAKQLGVKPKFFEPLKTMAYRARHEHNLAGAGDISNIPYAGPVLNELKPVVREAAVVANFPLEVIQGAARNAAQNFEEGDWLYDTDPKVPVVEQTQLGTQVGNLLEGKTTNIGDGFLPDYDSPVARQTVRAQRQAAPTIGGHAWSLGRASANVFFEPDTLPFQTMSGFIDAGVAYKADPTSLIVGTIGDLRQNAKRFAPQIMTTADATGLRPTSSRLHFNQMVKGDFLAGNQARRTAEKALAANAGNPSAMMRWINDANPASPAFPITTVHGEPLIEQLADSKDADEFLSVMERTSQVQAPFRAPGVSYHIKNGLDTRLLAAMPRGTIDVGDKNHAWKVLDDVMRSARVPVAERDVTLNTLIRSDDQFAAVTAVGDTIANTLIHQFNVDPKKAKEAGSFFADAHTSSRNYATDQMTGQPYVRGGVSIAGEAHPIDSPRLLTEGLNSPLPIPDTRELRRLASDLNMVTSSKAWKTGQTALRAPQALWSPLQILSARQATRDLFETQVNLAGRGHLNWFTDPLKVAGTIIGAAPDSKKARWLERVGIKGRYQFDAEAQNLVAETDDLLMHSMLQFTDPDTVITRGFINVPPNHAEAAHGLGEELGRMHGDPIMKGIAEAADPAAAKAWFWAGEGKEHRLARAPPMLKRVDDHRMGQVASGQLTSHIVYGDVANDPAAADRFIDDLYRSLVDTTGGNQELLDAVRTGQLRGRSVLKGASRVRGEDLSVVDDVTVKALRELMDGGAGPKSFVKVREKLKKLPTDAEGGKALKDKTLDALFHYMVDVPDKYLNRNLAWQQTQWKSYIEHAHMLSADDLASLKELAKRNRISKAQMRALDNVKTDVSEARRFTLKELTKLGKYEAADEMTKIVHDLSSRSQFFDMVKFMVPFGDAFRLVATRMVKLAADEPQVVRRAQQGIQAARQPESSVANRLLGDPIPEGQPFFHDDAYGNEVATIPGSAKFNEAVWEVTNKLGVGPGGNPLGIPLGLHTQGLKMVGELLPGFGGPAVSFTALWLIPEGTMPEQVENLAFPYGPPRSKGIAADIGGVFIPRSVQRMMGGPIDEQALARGVNDQLAMLAETGEYDMKDPKDLVRLAEDAKANATWLERVKGFGSFATPGYPSFEFSIHDKEGRLVDLQTIGKLISDHSKVKDGYNPDKGMAWFIKTFGEENIFATQAATRSLGYAAPVSRKGKEWADAHPEVKQAGDLVYGFFAPQDKNNIDNWSGLIEEGEVESLTAEQQIAASQNRLGWYAHELKKDAILKAQDERPLTDKQEKWFRDVYDPYLKEQLPGFNSYLANPFDTTKKRDSAIEQLYAVSKLPSVRDTGAGQGLVDYLVGRDKAIAAAKGPKYDLAGPFQAKKAKPLRDYLRNGVAQIIEQHPEFAPLWEQIFSRELAKDVE